MKKSILKSICLILALVIIFSACQKSTSDVNSNNKEIIGTSSTIESSNNKDNTSLENKNDNTEAKSNSNSTTKAETSSTTVKEKNSNTSKKNVNSSKSGNLRVKGTHLVDKNGNTIQLKGISTHGIAWYPQYVNKECFKSLRDTFGINTIRLAMYTAEYGGYCSGGNQEELKRIINNGVKYATELNMYVIIDWHILSDGNPKTNMSQAKAFFKEMSAKYNNQANVIYEICNEPNGGTSWDTIKSYAQEIIPIIREKSPNALIIVGTPTWSQDVDVVANNPITKYDNIVYALHFYSATHKDDLRNKAKTALNKGLPIFVSEFGICDASGNGAIDEASANAWIKLLNQYSISYVAWNLSNKDESSSILKSSCQKTSGFDKSDLSQSGLWLLKTIKGKNAVSVETTNKAESTTKKQVEKPTEATTTKIKASANIVCKSMVVNTWEQDGKTFYQYELVLKNTGKAKCEGWNISISFNEDFTLSDSWCGFYTKSGKAIKITNESYNGTINANESISNIGFIVSGSNNLKVK